MKSKAFVVVVVFDDLKINYWQMSRSITPANLQEIQ